MTESLGRMMLGDEGYEDSVERARAEASLRWMERYARLRLVGRASQALLLLSLVVSVGVGWLVAVLVLAVIDRLF